MLAILNSLNAHNLPIFQPILMIFFFFLVTSHLFMSNYVELRSIFSPILMILASKFMVYKALSGKTYLSSRLLSPLKFPLLCGHVVFFPGGNGNSFIASFTKKIKVWKAVSPRFFPTVELHI